MDSIASLVGLAAAMLSVWDMGIQLLAALTDNPGSFWSLFSRYGIGGVFLWVFGSSSIWRMQQQVLESDGDQVAMDFKTSIQNESNMIAVAVRAPPNSQTWQSCTKRYPSRARSSLK
jgi:hypothetical protein